MKILLIRHGDPNYEVDWITEKGRREANLLADYLKDVKIDKVYCSTMGRARRTAQPFLDQKGMIAEYCPWLREFAYARVKLPYKEKDAHAWDLLPEFINSLDERVYSPTEWKEVDFIKNSTVPFEYDNVCKEFDKVLAKHGYERNKFHYNVTNSNHDTIAFVCHFGLTAVLLSHIMNCSPVSIWQHGWTAPTSITTLYTEERRDGIAQIRATNISEVTHLLNANETPSFQARFCECFLDDTRHD